MAGAEGVVVTEYDNTDRGVLFAESEKKSDKHPDYTGTINVGGQDFRLAGWKKQSKSGNWFLSLAVSEQREPAAVGASDDDEDCPF